MIGRLASASAERCQSSRSRRSPTATAGQRAMAIGPRSRGLRPCGPATPPAAPPGAVAAAALDARAGGGASRRRRTSSPPPPPARPAAGPVARLAEPRQPAAICAGRARRVPGLRRDPVLAAGLVGSAEHAIVLAAPDHAGAPRPATSSPGGGASRSPRPAGWSGAWRTTDGGAHPRRCRATAPPTRAVASTRPGPAQPPGARGGDRSSSTARPRRTGSQTRLLDLGTGVRRVVRLERRTQLLNPIRDRPGPPRALHRNRPGAPPRPPRPDRTRPARSRSSSTTPTARRDRDLDTGRHRYHGLPRQPPAPSPRAPRRGHPLWTTALGRRPPTSRASGCTAGRRPRRC